ncbi:unnamed protein product [Lymnaea stagnalis]|uniref:Uncharacterized protein n=1 Tax=Lymnaea stagnalis TaxID=6523 RepID=A0AAV2H6T0_LYMST
MQLFIKIVYCCIGLLSFNTVHLAHSLVGSFPCGENCTCTNNSLYQTIAQCSNIKAIPLDLPRNISELDLSWNQITFQNVTGQDMCKIYTNMSQVSFAWNGITEMSPIFSGCWKLVALDLTGNKLKSLSSKTLQGLDKIKMIIGLEVEKLQSDTFKGFFNLEILNLTFYGITMQPNVFTYLSGLKRLHLSLEKMMIPNEEIFHFDNGNSLKILKLILPRVKDMPARLLNELKALEFLSLDAPSLSEFKLSNDSKLINLKDLEILRVSKLDPDLLEELEFLEILKLREISQVAELNLYNVPLLKELEVVHCSLLRIPSQWLSNATALETLNLSDDELTVIDPKDFSNLKSLRHLVLSNNKLSKLPSFFLEPVKDSLQQLIIRHNQLKTLEHDAISNLSLVEVIDFSFNHIETIEDGNFLHLPQLKILNLKNNYISALKPTMFITSPLLVELNLADNYFCHFPMEVIGTGVIELNLSVNRINTVPGKKLCGTKTLRTLLLDDNPISCDCSLKELLICELHIEIKGICSEPQSYAGIDIGEFTGCSSVTKTIFSTSTEILETTPPTTIEQSKEVNKKPILVLKGDQSEIVRPIIWGQKLLTNFDDAQNVKNQKDKSIEQANLNNQVHMQTHAKEGNESDPTKGPGSHEEQGH